MFSRSDHVGSVFTMHVRGSVDVFGATSFSTLLSFLGFSRVN